MCSLLGCQVYGAFETLLDLKQQWRLLFVLGKLQGDETTLFELEAEEEERFEWWWQANVPQIERQAAEAEGGELEAIGEQWISDGKGGNVDEVAWIGPTAAMRMCEEGSVVFLDCRERWEYDIEHIQGTLAPFALVHRRLPLEPFEHALSRQPQAFEPVQCWRPFPAPDRTLCLRLAACLCGCRSALGADA